MPNELREDRFDYEFEDESDFSAESDDLEYDLEDFESDAAPYKSDPVLKSQAAECCATAKTCAPVPCRVTTMSVDGIPFEYVSDVSKGAGGLMVITQSQKPRRQNFVPEVYRALSGFVQMLQQVGLNIETVLTMGSHVCRCIKRTGTNCKKRTGLTNTLSDHSSAQAIDIVGVRWKGTSPGKQPYTLVHNFGDATERKLLMRLNAALRLVFPQVIDYRYNAAHHNHFHCDLNNCKSYAGVSGAGCGAVDCRNISRFALTSLTTAVFLQEALEALSKKKIAVNYKNKPVVNQLVPALRAVTGLPLTSGSKSADYPQAVLTAFMRIASGQF